MRAPSSTPCCTSCVIFSSCTGAMIAPISTALSSGSPTRSFSMRARSLSSSASATLSCTSSREPAQQTWPWLNQIASTTPSTTESRSASSKTTNGDLPPSSSERRLPLPAVARRMMRPTSVEPVKAILSTSGCLTSASPVRAVAGDDVDHARRQADLLADLGEGNRGHRGELGGLEHHRVAHRRARARSSRPASAAGSSRG